MNTDRHTNLIVVTEHKKKRPVDLNVVLKIKAADGSSVIHFINDRVLFIHQPIQYFEDMLKNRPFVKINRTCLINLQYVLELKLGRLSKVVLTDASKEIVSPKKAILLNTILNQGSDFI